MTEGDDETAEYIRNIVREEAKNVNVSNNNNNKQGNEVSVKNLTDFADAGRKLKSAFESPIENAIVSKFNENFMDRIFPMMNNEQSSRKSSFLDSGFMISVGQGLPNALPNILDMLMVRIGKENTDNVMSGITNTFLGGEKQQNSQIDNTQNNQNINEIIMSLNPDDPADLHKYMSAFNIENIDEARKELIEKKSYIMSKINEQQQMPQQQQNINQNSDQNNNLEKSLQEQNNMIKGLIDVINEDKQNIQLMMNEISNLKEKEKLEQINKELNNMSEVPDIIDTEVNEVNEVNEINDNKSEIEKIEIIEEMNIINNNDIKVNFEEIDDSKEKVLK